MTIKTAKEIYESMVSRYEEACGKTLADDCDMAIRMYAAAAEIEGLYIYNDWVKKQCFPATAEGEYLDGHAAMRGMTRNAAVNAEGKIRFYINDALETDTVIESGVMCLTGGGVYFETVEDGVIRAGELHCDIPARAVEAGTGGNVTANTVVYMVEAPIGVSECTNTKAFTGGADEENDESLRARVIASYKTLPNGANKAYYEKTVLGVEGVGDVLVLPKNRGLGTVDIVITSQTGMPENELTEKVAALLDSMREICVDIRVAAPESVTVDVTAAIDVEDGYEFDEVKAAVEKAIQGLFNGTLLGKNVTIAKIGNIIYGVDGVKNYSVSAPAEDVAAASGVLPVMGAVTIKSWGQ